MLSTPAFDGRLRLPVIAAPMFLVSGPRLVIEACKAGVVGTFPALNQRTSEGYVAWLDEITAALAAEEAAGRRPAPYGVNLIVHKTNTRLAADIGLTVRAKVPIVITSLGAVREVVDAVHSYGGLVLHDVTTARHADKAIAAGADGVIAVSAGAGGHAGTINPFALTAELRPIVGDKLLVLAGAISTGQATAAAIAAGADLAYLGTRFIATQESLAHADYKAMLVSCGTADIVYTPKVSGIPANFLLPSLTRAGVDPKVLAGEETHKLDLGNEAKAWATVWSAGHGVAAIHDVPTVADLVGRLDAEYQDAVRRTARHGHRAEAPGAGQFVGNSA
jgi:nitronate monooxygenase